MRRALALLVATVLLDGSSPISADTPGPQTDPYEIRLPEEQFLHEYKTADHPPAALLAGRADEELGGRWHVGIWNQYSSTGRRAYGTGVDLLPSGGGSGTARMPRR